MTLVDKYNNHPELQRFRCPLEECDPTAYDRLNQEIRSIESAGYDVTIGLTPDKAYDRPEKIKEVYRYLRERDEVLQYEKALVTGIKLGSLGVNPLKWSSRRAKRVYQSLEPLRDRLLFGSNEADAQPWHRQRGRAAALLSIALAHDLKSVEGGAEEGFQSMSGMLDETVLEYIFPNNSGFISGMSISEAITATEQNYSGKSLHVATKISDKRISEMAEFVNAPSSEKFLDIVRYCSDGLGIRSRKSEVGDAISSHVLEMHQSTEMSLNDMIMLSFGCGTALPMLEVLDGIKKQTGDCPKLLLIDQDPLALASAAVIAKKMDLADRIEMRCERLFTNLGNPLDLGPILAGRKVTVAEDSGLREYLPDRIYTKLTSESWRHLIPGGLMTTGNMNTNRPQSEFLHGMMGWQPDVQMRHISEGFRLHEKAGIPRGNTRARVTRDGVYTLFFSKKDE